MLELRFNTQGEHEPVRCPHCHTRLPLVRTGRPPLVARFSDGVRRLYCPCGVVLRFEPPANVSLPRRQCPACRAVYDSGASAPVAQPAALPAAELPAGISYGTDMLCLACGRVAFIVPHSAPVLQVSAKVSRRRCDVCGGSLIRGETYVYYSGLKSGTLARANHTSEGAA